MALILGSTFVKENALIWKAFTNFFGIRKRLILIWKENTFLFKITSIYTIRANQTFRNIFLSKLIFL